MQEERIRLSSTDSINSVNKENFVDVNVQHHTKLFPFPSVSDTIDQREVFESERESSTKYRLILTINPYCSNVLFNAVTELVQNEGSDKTSGNNKLQIVGYSTAGSSVNTGTTINGEKNPNNVDMVRNTEYANGSRPFVYHCGYDMFNNHILRNQTFKLVNGKKSDLTPGTKDNVKKNSNVYNTIRDYMRYNNRDYIPLVRRTDVKTIENGSSNKHLYLKDDILSVTDCINTNLSEENGWWGFVNRSSIPSSIFNESSKTKWEDLNISKVFNGDNMSCGFIEMYPDSTLYSFSPKYNSFQNREEYNWDICLTYPYENIDGNSYPLVTATMSKTTKEFNSLLLASYEQTIGTSGQNIILFRSFVKHNLNVGDKIKLFYNLNNTSKESNFYEFTDRIFNVVNIGNLNDEYQDYYFYINDVEDVIQEINKTLVSQGGKAIEDLSGDDTFTFRFVKVNNDRDCKYYYRKFRKLPNLKIKKEELTKDIVEDKNKFESYVDNNCKKNGKMYLFNKEQYQLAFSRTIYGDNISQITFTDTIDIDDIRDNLGRPLTEIFVTIIKRNAGHNLWYNTSKSNTDLKNIEFSHCFGNVTSGLDIHEEWSDSSVLQDRKTLGDVTTISNSGHGSPLESDITIDTDEFFGDVVELDCYNMQETVLSDVCFRFNTEQREHVWSSAEINCSKFIYDEIETDDYDKAGFVCKENDADTINGKSTTYRPEGYFYKAHYPIKVREFGLLRQGSHKDIKISSCRPRQAGGMFIEIVSTLRSGVTSGSIVYLYDNTNNLKIPLTVNSVQSNVRFLLNPMTLGDENYKHIFNIIEGLTNGTYKLRLKNEDIPSYAYEVGTNVYLWRDVLNVGNKDTVELSEYPFANGHFYVNKNINFFLKRQDPFGHNGLMDKDLWPNDIYGNSKKTSNYSYKDDSNVVC